MDNNRDTKLKSKFDYETNACWGEVKTYKDLAELAVIQIEAGGGIRNIDSFLRIIGRTTDGNKFGVRFKKDQITLKQHLGSTGELEGFLEVFNEIK